MEKIESIVCNDEQRQALVKGLAGVLNTGFELSSPDYRTQYLVQMRELAKVLAAVIFVEERGSAYQRHNFKVQQAALEELSALERALLPAVRERKERRGYAPIKDVEAVLDYDSLVRSRMEALARAGLIESVTQYQGSGEYALLGYTLNNSKRQEAFEFLKKHDVLPKNWTVS